MRRALIGFVVLVVGCSGTATTELKRTEASKQDSQQAQSTTSSINDEGQPRSFDSGERRTREELEACLAEHPELECTGYTPIVNDCDDNMTATQRCLDAECFETINVLVDYRCAIGHATNFVVVDGKDGPEMCWVDYGQVVICAPIDPLQPDVVPPEIILAIEALYDQEVVTIEPVPADWTDPYDDPAECKNNNSDTQACYNCCGGKSDEMCAYSNAHPYQCDLNAMQSWLQSCNAACAAAPAPAIQSLD